MGYRQRLESPARRLSVCGDLAAFSRLNLGGLLLDQGHDLFSRGPAHHVKLEKFHHPLVRTTTDEKLQHQSGDQREVNLNGDPLRRFGKEMAAAQDAFDPAEEQLDGPTPTV